MAKYLDFEGLKTLTKVIDTKFVRKDGIDTTFAEVVASLPTDITKIKKHLYLVPASTTTSSQNVYSEYIYIGEIGTDKTYDASKWEKLGEFKSSIDLSECATKEEAINNIITDQDNDTVRIIYNYADGDSGDTYIAPANASQAGVMTIANFNKLQGIADGANKTIVDSTLSASSANPVQNKVIKAALEGKADSDMGIFTTAVGTPELVINASTADEPSNNKICATGVHGTADIMIQHSNANGAVNDVVKVNVDGVVVNDYSYPVGGDINNLDWTLTGNKTNITGKSVTSPKIIKTGGTSQQALMADGSVATRITEDEIQALFN